MARLLDLFCGAGGASMGYHRAGFKVVGIDLQPQPNYPFEFVQADALTYSLDGFDAFHASPPCQSFTVYGNNRARMKRTHKNLIPATRERLRATGRPYVIENVVGAPLVMPVQICGTGLGLEVRRHRWFESNRMLFGVPCQHWRFTERKYPGSTNRPSGRTVCNVGEWRVPLDMQRAATEIDWMEVRELSQAIPPAYTEHLGKQLIDIGA